MGVLGKNTKVLAKQNDWVNLAQDFQDSIERLLSE